MAREHMRKPSQNGDRRLAALERSDFVCGSLKAQPTASAHETRRQLTRANFKRKHNTAQNPGQLGAGPSFEKVFPTARSQSSTALPRPRKETQAPAQAAANRSNPRIDKAAAKPGGTFHMVRSAWRAPKAWPAIRLNRTSNNDFESGPTKI